MTWSNGLPPVGTHCECTWGWKGLWVECIYHGKLKNGMPIIEELDGGLMEFESTLENVEFRPLKSKAELKREKAVEEMIADSTFYKYSEYPDCTIERHQNSITKETAERLHQCGYRKVNELTDEQITSFTGECFQTSSTRIAWMNGAEWARSQIMGEES